MTEGFVVAIKKSARVRNSAVESLYETEGDQVTYPSAAMAREAVAELASRGEGPVRLQAVAPQDGSDVDGYLVGASRHDLSVPETPPEAGWTFGVDASQYGALGEALLTAGDGASRPVRSFVRYDQDLEEETPLVVTVDTDPAPVSVPGEGGSWEPDCQIEATVGHHTIGTYYAEVKTGNGRLERSQEAAIDAAARDTPVLLVWVDVAGLPAEYTVEFEKIDHTGPGASQEQLTFEDLA
ncbi:MAG: hypothetical protein ABEJ57_05970 [Halobacteriaceae archaeon]